jgi:hypothetical protein
VDEAFFLGGFQIGFDDAFDVAWRDGVEVEDVGDGEFEDFVFAGFHADLNIADWFGHLRARGLFR